KIHFKNFPQNRINDRLQDSPQLCGPTIEILGIRKEEEDNQSEYITEYIKQFSKLEKDYFHGYVYDTIWSLTYLYQSHLLIFISISICSGIGLFISWTFLDFNIHFRSHRYIRMSSPTLDNIILAGLENKMETINYYPSDTTIGSILFNNYISEEIRCLTVKELTSSQSIDRLGASVSDSPYDLALGSFDKKMIVVLLVIKGFVVCPWHLGHI
ncbi:unnamed protein product, partial [Rotaria sordida]